jgi:Clostripain family/Bacterial pre-peptidase C-terminal domain
MKKMMLFGLVTVLLLIGITVQGQTTTPEPIIYTGDITNAQPFKLIPLDVPRDDTTIILDILPIDGSELDTQLFLLDGNDRIVAENDDRVRGDSSSYIELPQAAAGSYRIVVTRYGVDEGDSEGTYELKVTLIPQLNQSENNLVYDVSEEALQAAGYPATNPNPEAIWTVLVYYGADNNLEPAILNDLNEFEIGGGSNQSVRVVALVDNLDPVGNDAWSTARLFEVGRDVSGDQLIRNPATIDTDHLQDLGEVDTSSGDSFAKFLVWGVRNFPAQNYVIAMGSHGAGWHGLITDDTTAELTGEKVILSLPQLQASYRLALQEAGVEKFALLINDACLMGSVEYNYAMSEFFNLSLASPEIVVNPAHDMFQFIATLKTNTGINMSDLAQTLADIYIKRDVAARQSSDAVYLTSSVFDLRDYGRVKDALDRFAATFSDDPTLYTSILDEARASAYVYSSYVGGKELVDLGNLMRLVIVVGDEPEMLVAAQDVLTALDAVTLYGVGGSLVSEQVSNYQNIFFPGNSTLFSNLSNQYFDETAMGAWGRMLRSYYNELTPQVFAINDPQAVQFHPPVVPVIQAYGTFPSVEALTDANAEISMETGVGVVADIVGRNMNAYYLTVERIEQNAEGNPVAVRYSEELILTDIANGVAKMQSSWDATLPYLQFGDAGNFELLRLSGIDEISGSRVASVEGRYRLADSDIWNDVSLVFDATNYRVGGVLQRVVNRSTETGAVADVVIPTGAIFQTKRFVVVEGKVNEEEGNTYTWNEGGPIWEWRPAPNGEYNASFVVNTSGGTNTFSTRVTVNNDEVDSSLRADPLPFAHMSVPRPQEWTNTQIEVILDGFRVFRSFSPDRTQNITIYYRFFSRYPELLNDNAQLEDAIRLFADTAFDAGGYELVSEPSFTRDIVVDGKPAIEFDYRYTNESDERVNGRGYVLFHSSDFGQVAYFVTTETTAEPTTLNTVYSLLTNNIRLWDFETPNADDTAIETENGVPLESAWDFEPDPNQPYGDFEPSNNPEVDLGGTEFLVPVTYGDGVFDEDWVRFNRNNTADSGTFAKVRIVVGSPDSDGFNVITDLISSRVGIVVQIEEFRRYRNKYSTWFSVTYRGERDGRNVYGRMYTTAITLDQTYYIQFWIETPIESDIEITRSIIRNELEPIIDSFKIPGVND